MRLAPLNCLALLAGLGLSCSALAIPGTIKPVHPRLYATQADIEQLKQAFPHGGPFPRDKGKIELTLTAALKAAGDPEHAMLLGTATTTTNAIMIRHVDDAATESGQNKLRIQVALIKAGAGYYAFSNVYVTPGVQTKITLSYDSAARHVEVTADKAIFVEPVTYKDLPNIWQPDNNQQFDFDGRRNDVVKDVVVSDGAGKEVWRLDQIDYELRNSRISFLFNAGLIAERIKNVCVVTASPVKDPSAPECDVATGSRNHILEAAKTLGLAYKLSGDPKYLEAARKYVNVIFGITDHLVGGEWSMNPRVAALGVIYDWFFTELDDKTRADIRSYILATIRADNQSKDASNDDLIAMICGSTVKLNTSATTLDCASEPDISRFYIMGHHASAMTGAVLGLLAIVDESTSDGVDVRPMIDRIYTHLEKGLIPARDYISVDGGHQTMSSYNSTVGEMIERLIMWRRVLTPPAGVKIAETKFEPKVIQPFIYAYRGDRSFTAGSDNFELTLDMPYVGYMSLAAAVNGEGTGASFYQYVKSARRWGGGQRVWDTLYFPGAGAKAVELSTLPLSRYFRVAGNVFMRDSWDYANSTLLDFKSTSFISENHQHLDQNSFSLFRHAPLLVDSGIYDAYGSAHWNNYYYRTIAHNSLIVFDPNEVFSDGTTTFSNDGGQWFKNGQARYPTMAEIKPLAVNALDGVTQYEDGAGYAFVTGNASKAYSNKLDQKDGFLRSIFYLRPKTAGGKTSILVFDRVHTAGLPATSLLHTVGKPSVHVASTTGDAGRVNLAAAPNNFPLLVRNGGGMLTIEPLLPKNASITLAGGESDNQCMQVTTENAPAESPYDCRFTVRTATGNGQFAWYNFAPKVGFDKVSQSDFGVWRLEISAGPDQSATAKYQWFLNVLHVEDARPEADPTVNSSVLLDSSDGSAAAVAVEAGVTVVFAKSSAPAASLRWKSTAGYQGTILAGGLQPSMAYVRSFNASTQETVLLATPNAGPEVPRASKEGVLSLTVN